jgi:orotate phosphoribosyltransferase
LRANNESFAVKSRKIAEYLLKIKAVRIAVESPFTWSSGWRSPIYCDNRLILSYPEIREEVKQAFVELVREKYPHADGIAGVATGAIAWGALVADELGLPFVYVRAKAKGHGLQNLVEGKVKPDMTLVVIEDLVSTGKSSVAAVKSLQEAGAEVLGTLSIFSYGFPQADQAFAATKTSYSPLTNLEALLEKAIEIDYLGAQEKDTIFSWQQNPAEWGPKIDQ